MLFPLLEQIANRILRLDRESLQRLGEFEGKVIAMALVRTAGAAPDFYLFPSAEGLRLVSDYDGIADVTLRGDLSTLLRVLVDGAKATPELIATRALEIEGDVDLGRRFQRFLEGLDIDWEEQTANVLGDVVAHRLGNVVRDMRTWRRHATQTLSADIAEYLQEESRLLTPAPRVEAFLEAVDALRADVDRLEARLRRLQGRC
jgi:ubiquinone biosynthesis protein UbiJ